MRRNRRLGHVCGKWQAELPKRLAIGRIGLHFGRIAIVEAGIVAALVTGFAGTNLLNQRFQLNRVGPEGQRIVLLLVEELFARRVEHSRRFLRAEHRVRIDLHPLPARWMRHVIGVPPLHFHVEQGRTGTPRQRDAIRRHLPRARRARMQPIRVAGRQNDRARDHDRVFAADVVQAEHASDRTV